MTDDRSRRLGARIRELRTSRRLTLVQLAGAAHLSHPFLSQVERGVHRPSLASLERIARALGSSQVELLAAMEDAPSGINSSVVVRRGEGVQGEFGGASARMLAHGYRGFRPMELVGDGLLSADFVRHAEAEFIYVVAGRVLVELASGVSELLEAGDSIHLQGGEGHRWHSPDGSSYRMVVVKEAGASPDGTEADGRE